MAWVTRAADADAALDSTAFDLVVLDLGLPDQDGLSLLARWRRLGRDEPVLVLTARDGVEHRVTGLNAGADDYLVRRSPCRAVSGPCCRRCCKAVARC